MDNYIYRLVFTYPATPDKIGLPFVEYAPNQIIFNFERELSPKEIDKFCEIAQSLDLSETDKVTYKIQKKYQGHWVEEISAETLAYLIQKRYNLNTSPDLSEDTGVHVVGNNYSNTPAQREDWRSYISGMYERWPGLPFVINDGILKEGKYLIV